MTWIIYNEGWGQLPTAPELELTPQLRSMDPTRLIDSVTGWNDHGAGDFSDNHHVSLATRALRLLNAELLVQYSDPQCGTPWYSTASSPYDPTRIGFQGEFGGMSLDGALTWSPRDPTKRNVDMWYRYRIEQLPGESLGCSGGHPYHQSNLRAGRKRSCMEFQGGEWAGNLGSVANPDPRLTI